MFSSINEPKHRLAAACGVAASLEAGAHADRVEATLDLAFQRFCLGVAPG